MEISLKVRATRFAQVEAGDLFLMRNDTGAYVALAVEGGPRQQDDLMMLLLGPPSDKTPEIPKLTYLSRDWSIVSLGKSYELRLPCDSEDWLSAEPQKLHPLVVLEEEKLYIRARFNFAGQSATVYVDINKGKLRLDGSGNFIRPDHHCAYVLKWSLWTVEQPAPQAILSFPLVRKP